VDTTVDQFAASGPELAVAVTAALIDAVNASALAITTEARAAIKRAVGADARLGHMHGRPRVGVFYARARANRPAIVAPIRASGPAHLIERPRKGGYTVTATGKALRTPHGPRKRVHPGPVLFPAAPITRTFARAGEIIERTAPVVLDRSLAKGMEKALTVKVVAGG
jgi:hypothetical protein